MNHLDTESWSEKYFRMIRIIRADMGSADANEIDRLCTERAGSLDGEMRYHLMYEIAVDKYESPNIDGERD